MRRYAESGQQGGVTLLELMIALAVVALLGSLAIPAFTGYIDRARVARAIGDIGGLSLQLYRWQSANLRFPDTLAEANLDDRMDPWGQPYEYLNIATSNPNEPRKDKNLHPINTDFDLYSIGKDGKSVNALTAKPSDDDVLRANNGGFIGLGKNY
ncbi:MAG TPA: prepilin-type N-terminal cleavage/methylation domain-containing protein [Gammaproteobacteria bacterium]|nr:prepilin-type N-terminal cleavage/methylation domain-containing protein [Gammaproteobacteria bacterium]